MTDLAALNELLEDSLEHATLVTVSVSRCQYRCCGGGWQDRYVADDASPEFPIIGVGYTGRVLSIDVDEFLLDVPNPLGKHAEVIARFEHLLDVNPAVD